MLVYLKATNCPNGNPRRGFAWLEDGHPLAFWPEGYAGYMAPPKPLHYAARRSMLDGVTITAGQYSRLKILPSPADWPENQD